MSAKETASPCLRIAIGLATGPNPPWTGVRFTCRGCGALYQLGADDECERAPHRRYRVPPCWTCDRVNEIELPANAEWERAEAESAQIGAS